MSHYPPQLYDLVHRGNHGDTEFYLKVCREARRVLELGCGSGRISAALMGAGKGVVGVDNNPLAVERAVERAVGTGGAVGAFEGVVGDMGTMALSRVFDVVIAPYNTMFCLLSKEEWSATLGVVREHLVPGGIFAFDVYHLPEGLDDSSPGSDPDDEEQLITACTGDALVHVFERPVRGMNEVDPRRFDVEYRYQIQEDGGEREQLHRIAQRGLTRPEMEGLLAAQGFEITSVYGDRFAPGVDDETEQIAYVSKLIAG